MLLEVKNLKVEFQTSASRITAVAGISFSVTEGTITGIIGESGSGKSAAMLAVMRLLPENGCITDGQVLYKGRSLVKLKEKEMLQIRGKEIGLVLQDPGTSLNPLFKTGCQLTETIIAHQKTTKKEATLKAIELLNLTGITDAEKILLQYPHELSGGMKQRIMLALALCCQPKILIADEPTTALDILTQVQIINLIKDIKRKTDMSMIFVTHNLALAAEICDRILVMQEGRIVEDGSLEKIFNNPVHQYTKMLKSIPAMDFSVIGR